MGVCHCNEKQTELGSIEFENPIITQRQEKSNTSFYQKPTSNSPLCQTQAVFRGYLTRSLFKKKVEVETMQEIQITFNYEELNEVPNFLSHKATQTLRNISEFVYTDKAIGVISRGPVKLPDHSIYIGE